jgi:hypothetical protein
MPVSRSQFPVLLTQAQRRAVAVLLPELADRLKLGEKNQRAIPLSLAELKEIRKKAAVAVRQAESGMVRNSLRCLTDITTQALERFQGLGSIPAAERVYQFKIALKDSHPPIWRRIQVKDCTLDKLHEHIQTAMGWTNSHLNHFHIGEQPYGDPDLMQENYDEFGYEDSTSTRISDILPKTGRRFRFDYEYDFGDAWHHDVLFEGCVRAEPGTRYPVCVEGARACPPEDVGGVWGYEEFGEAMADPEHERHEEFAGWIGGSFDAETFDASSATKRMRRGLPDWRTERWI